jgi:tetratricopeptide (TPR) repeat protein
MQSNIPGLEKEFHETDPERILLEVRRHWKLGDFDHALLLLRESARHNPKHVPTLRLFAEFSPVIEEKILACETILQFNPADEVAKVQAKLFRQLEKDPENWATYLEEQGQIAEAISVYKGFAALVFDHYYREISRLENYQFEKIKFVNPSLSVIRLSLGLPIFYALLVLMQFGFRPVMYAPLIIWMGMPVVAAGSFLIAMSGVGSTHLFLRNTIRSSGGAGLKTRRMTLTLAGWLLILVPYALILLNAMIRMQTFEPPPLPLVK